MTNSQSVSALCLRGGSLDIGKEFWQQWEQYRDSLYRCCIKWMGGNPTDAEDALSRAMLKALEKVGDETYVITNFKAWLIRLTHNLCIDMHRECNRNPRRIENKETIDVGEDSEQIEMFESPLSTAMRQELGTVIQEAIDELPPRLREPFVLHFFEELSYRDIAQQLAISYANVCKRISQARAMLRLRLQSYLGEEESTASDVSGGLSLAPPLPKEGQSGSAILPEPVLEETLASSGELEEGSVAAGGVSEDRALSVVERVPAMVVAPSEAGSGDIERVELGVSSPSNLTGVGGWVGGWIRSDWLVEFRQPVLKMRELGDTGDESKVFLSFQSPIPYQVFVWDAAEGLFQCRQTHVQERFPRAKPVYRGWILPAVGKLSKLHLSVLKVRSHFIECWRVWADSGGSWLRS